MVTRIEYQVHEVDDEPWPHGSVTTDIAEARRDLQHKIDTYGPYGRRFVICQRIISEWSPTSDL